MNENVMLLSPVSPGKHKGSWMLATEEEVAKQAEEETAWGSSYDQLLTGTLVDVINIVAQATKSL